MYKHTPIATEDSELPPPTRPSSIPFAIKSAAAIAALGISISVAHADPHAMTGSGLLDVCMIPDYHWIDFCHGYTQAVVDATSGEIVCLPDGITRATVTTAVVERIAAMEELHDLNAFAVVHAVLQRTYPCDGS